MTTHLMVRSCFTMLGSTIRIQELVTSCKQAGYDAVALTDHNVMHGAAAFSHACAKEGIKPIYGLELDVLLEETTVPFLLLAKTNSGYCNLMRLSSKSQTEQKPVPFSFLCEHLDGLAIIVYGEGGWMETEMLNDDRNGILKKLQFFQQELQEFHVALSFQDASMWRIKNQLLKACCKSLRIPTVALNKIYYLRKDDDRIYHLLRCIRTQRTLNDSSQPVIHGRHLLSKEEMEALYDREDLNATDAIARECTATGETKPTSLPSFPVPEGLTSEQYLTRLCLAGLSKRLHTANPPQPYLNRLKYELDVINRMNFADYFLIVYDFIRYARKQGIYVGPGRGSAAGSLVSYCIGITMVDPLRYGLLFERFLNPDRVSMPDIDTDIPDDRRQEVIDYVKERYGSEHVANIVTFNTLGAKQVLRDLGKVMGIPSRDIDMLCRMVPGGSKTTLRQALQENYRLKEIVKAEERYKELFRNAARLEGLPRHTGVHPAGVILSSEPLGELLPLMNGEEGLMTSQFPAEYLEERGLIKMDFLSLRNLTMIDAMVKRIQETEPEFNILKIPETDLATFGVFCRGDTNGIFQFESEGMKLLLKQIRPDCFEDIVAAMALFRPASSDSIPMYLKNKQNPESIVYPSKELEPILKETYGILIYQEQTMRLSQIAAGFTPGQADQLRKAMSKKKEDELLNMKETFVKGCMKNGYENEKAEELFDLVLRFGGYGFNKSHAVAYGMIAWQTAYLKAHYPLIFYASLIDSLLGDSSRTGQYVDECRRRSIKVFGPDVSKSKANASEENGGIRLPLSAVKSVGEHAAASILQVRHEKPFEDFFDFVARVTAVRISKANIESLIDAGALDCFMENRATMKHGLDEAIRYGELVRIEENGQTVLDMSLVSKPVLVKMADSKEAMREKEMETLGFTLGAHPIAEVRARAGIHTPSLVSLVGTVGNISSFAYVASLRYHTTKRGERMAFLKLNDETADLDVMVMPRQLNQYGDVLRKGIYILFDGRMGEDGRCIVNNLRVVSATGG